MLARGVKVLAGRDMWPKDGVERLDMCPVCASGQRRALHADLVDRVFCATGAWNLYKCLSCGCGYLDPRPTPSTIHLAYQKYYTHHPPEDPGKKPLNVARRVRRSLANGYRNWRFGTRFEPSSKFGILAAAVVPGLRRLLDREFRNLPQHYSGSRLLDVGFGHGAFMELAIAAGWNVAGVDTDPVSVTTAQKRGLEVRLGSLEAFSDMPGSFDVITLSHVIEHLHDPRAAIKEIYRLLKPGGRVWIDTPNISSYGHQRFGRNWRGLEPPRHLVLFNWNALESVLEEEGFGTVEKVICHNAYSSLAAASKAIAEERDPYSSLVPTFSDRIAGIFFGLGSRLDYRRSEVVTLMAFKPTRGTCSV